MLNILGLARLQSGRTCKLKPWHFENNASPCLVPSKPVSNQCPQNFAQCTWVANAKKRLSTSASSFKKPQLIQQKKLWGINTQPHCRWQLQPRDPKIPFAKKLMKMFRFGPIWGPLKRSSQRAKQQINRSMWDDQHPKKMFKYVSSSHFLYTVSSLIFSST